MQKIREASILAKKGTKHFTNPYLIAFLSVLPQNKALHDFHKWQQDPIAR